MNVRLFLGLLALQQTLLSFQISYAGTFNNNNNNNNMYIYIQAVQ